MHIKNLLTARKYARALYTLCAEHLQQNVRFLMGVSGIVFEVEGIVRFFEHPGILQEEKDKLLDDLPGAQECPQARRMLSVIIEQNRLRLLPEIIAELEALARAQEKRQLVVITTAQPLSQLAQDEIAGRISHVTSGQAIEAQFLVDPSLIAGMRLAMGNRILDTSLLSSLRAAAVAGGNVA
jgi:F-type H+-transporting ATPase subunit delta